MIYSDVDSDIEMVFDACVCFICISGLACIHGFFFSFH